MSNVDGERGLPRRGHAERLTGAGTGSGHETVWAVPTPIKARYQSFGLMVYGALLLIGAVVFAVWDPADSGSRWFWVIAGPLAGLVVLTRSDLDLTADAGVDRPGAYIGVFVGAAILAVVLALFDLSPWVLPSMLFGLALVVAYLALVERTRIGVSTSMAIAAMAAALGVSTVGSGAAVMSAVMGAMFLSGAAALELNADDGPPVPAMTRVR